MSNDLMRIPEKRNMRKLSWQMNVTLDGFMEGPNRELNDTTQVVDEDFDCYCAEMLKSIDAIRAGPTVGVVALAMRSSKGQLGASRCHSTDIPLLSL